MKYSYNLNSAFSGIRTRDLMIDWKSGTLKPLGHPDASSSFGETSYNVLTQWPYRIL